MAETSEMWDFGFKRLGDGLTSASRVSVNFEVAGHQVIADTPEAMILLMILAEIRQLRKDLRASVGKTAG